jgi:uncharacterized membrane protein YbhN (UPF0104 family)
MRGTLRTAGGLLGAAVLGALLSDQQQLVVFVAIVAALCLAGTGLLSIPAVRDRWTWAQTAEDRASALEAALAGYLMVGNEIVRRVGEHPGSVDAALDELTLEARRWATQVRDRLQRDRPALAAVFLDDTSEFEYTSQYPEYEKLRSWMTRRLIRLGDVMERVARR